MNMSNFVERLEELIFDDGIKPTNLSIKLGFGNSTISHYLTGRYLPTVANVIILANYFNCTTDYLLGITEDSNSHTFKPCPPFGERIIALCKHFNISQYKLQQITGISETAMRYWVKGRTNPTILNVIKIAEKLDCSVDFILGRE